MFLKFSVSRIEGWKSRGKLCIMSQQSSKSLGICPERKRVLVSLRFYKFAANRNVFMKLTLNHRLLPSAVCNLTLLATTLPIKCSTFSTQHRHTYATSETIEQHLFSSGRHAMYLDMDDNLVCFNIFILYYFGYNSCTNQIKSNLIIPWNVLALIFMHLLLAPWM